jgi:hypothetical protein
MTSRPIDARRPFRHAAGFRCSAAIGFFTSTLAAGCALDAPPDPEHARARQALREGAATTEPGPKPAIEIDPGPVDQQTGMTGTPFSAIPSGATETQASAPLEAPVPPKLNLKLNDDLERLRGLTGAVTVGTSTIDANHPALRDELDDEVDGLPASVGIVPLGPSLSNLAAVPGVYLSLEELQQSNRELGLGIAISSAPSAACGGGSSQPTGGYGDDTPGNEPPVLEYLPDDRTNGGFDRDPGTVSGGTTEASTESVGSGSSPGR